MPVYVVGDRYFTTVFRLIGAKPILAESEEELTGKVEELMHKEDCEAVIIREEYAPNLSGLRRNMFREGRVKPLFIFVPGFEGATGDRVKEIYELITLAVGAKLRFTGEKP